MANLSHRILATHQWIYKHSHGVLGHRLLFGNPTLLLRTTGRRSGLPGTTALTYARDGDCDLIVASGYRGFWTRIRRQSLFLMVNGVLSDLKHGWRFGDVRNPTRP